MNRLEKAQAIKKEHDKRRQDTRDMMSRKNMVQKNISPRAQQNLNKLRALVKVSHAFHANIGIQVDTVAAEEVADRVRVERAKSAPALQIRPPQPDGEVTHLNKWLGPDHPLRSLRESTPWREQDE